MVCYREGEKGVTRKQRSKSTDHLNQSQVYSFINMCWFRFYSLNCDNDENGALSLSPHHLRIICISFCICFNIVSFSSLLERAPRGKHLSRYFSLTNPFNATYSTAVFVFLLEFVFVFLLEFKFVFLLEFVFIFILEFVFVFVFVFLSKFAQVFFISQTHSMLHTPMYYLYLY